MIRTRALCRSDRTKKSRSMAYRMINWPINPHLLQSTLSRIHNNTKKGNTSKVENYRSIPAKRYELTSRIPLKESGHRIFAVLF